mmetsp:Transcript_5497/g.6046  ORF Transcript_5497/g.6046 Transcript_5497/m.6046 type:complete len:99 (+) Transcript_5497:477-773(+)
MSVLIKTKTRRDTTNGANKRNVPIKADPNDDAAKNNITPNLPTDDGSTDIRILALLEFLFEPLLSNGVDDDDDDDDIALRVDALTTTAEAAVDNFELL